jgi:site-specific DNA-cytosine methylase
MLVESHFTGTGNFDRVLSWLHDDIQLMRAFDCDANAREVIGDKYQIVGNDILWSRDYGHADMIIGSPPHQLYGVAGSGRVLGISAEWRASLLRVQQAQPRWVVYECVTGAPWDAVRDVLVGMGYVVRFCNVRAYECGAPHVRARVFLLAAKEPLTIHAPSYKRYKGPMIPTPTEMMLIHSDCHTRKGNANFHDWVSKNRDIQAWPVEQWFQTIGWQPVNNDSLNSLVECAGEWLMGFTNNAIRKYHFSHRTACRLIGNATLPQQAHIGLWRTSLAVNRFFS